jgi:choline-sulfatase
VIGKVAFTGGLPAVGMALVSLWAAGLVSCGRAREAAPSWRGYNVIWVSYDSVRADHCSFNGYHRKTTPVLASLAARGVNFSNCVTQAPYTLPSYASMLSSRYISELAVLTHQAEGDPTKFAAIAPSLRPDDVLISETLKEAGYRTAAFGQSWVSAHFGFNQGWDLFRFKGGGLRDKLPLAMEWMDANKETPFFVFVYTTDPHYPFVHAHEKKGLFGTYASEFNFTLDSILKHREGRLKPSPEDMANAVALYDEGLYWTDHDLEPLLAYLRKSGLMDKTIIVFNADHGEEFNEHGVISHGQTYYEGVIKTPLVIYAPNLPQPGRTVHDLVENVDIVPTLLDMLEIEGPKASGDSLAPYLTRPGFSPPGPRVAYSAGAWTSWIGAAFQDDRKLIYVDPKTKMLFDLGSDPGEKKNLFETRTQVARALEDALFENLGGRAAMRGMEARDGTYDTWMKQVMKTHRIAEDAELHEQLKALGYVR